MEIHVKVAPNARSNEIIGWEEDPRSGRVLRIRLQAPPVDGKANKALLAFLSGELGVPRSRLAIVRGHTSRIKVIALPETTRLPLDP